MNVKKSKISPLWIVLIAVAAAGVAALWWSRAYGPATSPSAEALVGGPFSLLNQDGKRVTEQDFLGRYTLVFFGYTYCPDICPVELQTMAAAMDSLPPAVADKITPVFITIDPERDTVDVMASYVKLFHPRLVGLTGAPEEVAAAARAYRVYFQKAPGDSGSDAYLMDHSGIVYLMGPDGKFISHFSPGVKPEAMAARLRELIR